MTGFVLSVLMLAAFGLAFGGIRMLIAGTRFKGILMLLCALVLVGNVLVWTL